MLGIGHAPYCGRKSGLLSETYMETIRGKPRETPSLAFTYPGTWPRGEVHVKVRRAFDKNRTRDANVIGDGF